MTVADVTVKMKLIRILSQTINQIIEMEEESLEMKDGKIKFRQYQKSDPKSSQIHAINVTIEA